MGALRMQDDQALAALLWAAISAGASNLDSDTPSHCSTWTFSPPTRCCCNLSARTSPLRRFCLRTRASGRPTQAHQAHLATFFARRTWELNACARRFGSSRSPVRRILPPSRAAARTSPPSVQSSGESSDMYTSGHGGGRLVIANFPRGYATFCRICRRAAHSGACRFWVNCGRPFHQGSCDNPVPPSANSAVTLFPGAGISLNHLRASFHNSVGALVLEGPMCSRLRLWHLPPATPCTRACSLTLVTCAQ